ncbi:hypothetical protein [Methylobacterium brachythecii]|uniref:Uncharacterized protein n=1 Tax=Methylobacterium brachythecii TaxID=1176177 RepID=A0A7W6ADN5_9HYPH|nr:hypothetical protein [Methylobacterium brachythecii]MBB3901358.1 hypothetical protein [Methylobacterium brachythecii]GLS42933.1 hypothetical protein GCM10007884_09180 [Methylobacterium brachythecii]
MKNNGRRIGLAISHELYECLEFEAHCACDTISATIRKIITGHFRESGQMSPYDPPAYQLGKINRHFQPRAN